jgi:hypothetical protein
MRPASISPPSERQRRSFSIRNSRDKENYDAALAGNEPPVDNAIPIEETKEKVEEERPNSRRVRSLSRICLT